MDQGDVGPEQPPLRKVGDHPALVLTRPHVGVDPHLQVLSQRPLATHPVEVGPGRVGRAERDGRG